MMRVTTNYDPYDTFSCNLFKSVTVQQTKKKVLMLVYLNYVKLQTDKYTRIQLYAYCIHVYIQLVIHDVFFIKRV